MAVFAARLKEREELDYYLDFARTAPRHINVALVGQRASGKTSLLNYTEQAAKQKGIITCRIDLDEENVASSYAFFFKILDAIISASVRENAFGGLEGKFWETYRDLCASFKYDVDPEFMPFMFPTIYARVMAAGTSHMAPFPDNEFAQDLELISTSMGKKFCLIFDECDLLGNSRGILQKLRNIIQRSTGFIFVFAGTPKLFPVMDDVFSPIVRQFKKIEVRDFVDIDDTRECIRKPLELLNERDPSEFFPLDNLGLLREIHTLTSGRPYEIQLLCHSMFKKIQQHQASQMALDLAVLEDVQNELVSGQSLRERVVIQGVRKLSNDEMIDLQPFCRMEGGASLAQILDIERIGEDRDIDLSKLKECADKFLALKLIEFDGENYRFAGDGLDQIYTKYFAREKKLSISFLRAPPDGYLSIALLSELASLEEVHVFSTSFESAAPKAEDTYADWESFAKKFDDPLADPYAGAPTAAYSIYRAMIDARHFVGVPLRSLYLELPWTKLSFSWFAKESDRVAEALKQFDHKKPLIEKSGGSLTIRDESVRRIEVAELISRLATSANVRLRNRISEFHASELYTAYVHDRDLSSATFHAECIEKLHGKLNASDGNNVGYLLFKLEKFDGAKELFLQSLSRINDTNKDASYDKLILTYNLALTELALGDRAKSKALLADCVKAGDFLHPHQRIAACLHTFSLTTEVEPVFEERWNELDISLFAKTALELLDQAIPEDAPDPPFEESESESI
jgi:hypothetical protein